MRRYRPRHLVQQAGRPFVEMSRGYLAEPYDGVGQYVLVGLSRGSTSVVYKARVASGDFKSERIFPVGTPVHVTMYRGQVEVHLGSRRAGCLCEEDFNRVESTGLGTGGIGTWELPEGNPTAFAVNGTHGIFKDGPDNAYSIVQPSGIRLPFEALIELQARAEDPFIGWSGGGAENADLSFDFYLSENYFFNFTTVAIFCIGNYPGTEVGLSAQDDRSPIGESDFDDVIPFTFDLDDPLFPTFFMRVYIDEFGVYGRFWLKGTEEPVSTAPSIVPFHGFPAFQPQWLSQGGGRGEAWSCYTVGLSGMSGSIPYDTIIIGSNGLGNSQAEVDNICILKGTNPCN